MCTTSAVAIRASRQAVTVPLKISRTAPRPSAGDPRQARMVGKTFMQTVADEPADRDVDLRFPHQPAVVHNPEQQAREHQAHRHLRIDAGPTVVRAIAVRDFPRPASPGRERGPRAPGRDPPEPAAEASRR